LTGASWWAVADGDLLRAAIAVETARRKLEASQLSLLAEIHARGTAVEAGARSTASWLVVKTRLGRGEAQRTVRFATQLSGLAPAVRSALARGGIGVGHAVAISQVLAVLRERSIRVGSPVTYDVRAAAEATLLELAASLDPGQLATAGALLVDPHWNPFGDDPVLAEETRRTFTVSPLPDGPRRSAAVRPSSSTRPPWTLGPSCPASRPAGWRVTR
jgi:hypothetical protein